MCVPIRRMFSFALVTTLLTISLLGRADPFPLKDLPQDLSSWVPWVLDNVPDRMCPVIDGSAVCLWPGEMVFDLDGQGGTFAVTVLSDRDMKVKLPGGVKNWPQEVLLDGKRAVVLGDGNSPYIKLGTGTHRITGRFIWDEMPQGMPVPVETALISLTVNGKRVVFPRRGEDGLLALQSAGASEEEGEKLDVTVMRKLIDGIPFKIETRAVLRVSGKSREVALKSALVPGTVPLSVDSNIPARLDKDGNLRLQVRAGTHTVTLHSRTPTPLKSIGSIVRDEPWPTSEIWVWRSDESIRQASVTGAPGIDPSRTSLPEEWRGLPAYLVEPGGSLKIETKRRGQPESPPDQITLRREMWMDLNGSGYTVRDTLSGTLGRSWRLDLEADGELGHAALDGQDQLVTTNPKTKKPGVELRRKKLGLLAEWRIPGRRGDLPAVGWSEDVEQLNATLHLPPGWTLLFAKGVDELPGTWWDKWDLFGFFFVLIISLAVGKLTHPVFGGIAFLALVISHHEPDAPYAVWVSLLASLGLLKVLPKGRIKIAGKIWCWVSVIWLVIVLVPFSVQQVRTGLFPQVQGEREYLEIMSMAAPDPDSWRGPPQTIALPNQQEMAVAEDKEAGGLVEKRKGEIQQSAKDQAIVMQAGEMVTNNNASGLDSRSGRGEWGRKKVLRKAMQQDPKAVVQTGPGVPNWHWNTMRLEWSGPVTKDHRFKLFMMSPKVNLFISILRVLLLVLIGLRIASEIVRVVGKTDNGPGIGRGKTSRAKTAAAGVVLTVIMLSPTSGFTGEIPPDSMLTELLGRVTRTPECRPNCVSASKLEISIEDDQISFRAEVHTGDATSWPIPGPAKNWVPSDVKVDGRSTLALVTRPDGFVHVRIEPGFHEVVVRGPIPPGNTFTMELGLTPHHAHAEAPGWVVEGIGDDGLSEGSIQLSRSAMSNEEGKASFEEGSYPPWLEITRTFDFGIPWLVHTHVRRVSPTGSPLLERVPLLKGESVTESDLQVEKGEVVISLGRNETDLYWSSTLEEQPQMALTAPLNKPWTEIWSLKCSPVWQCDYSGLPPIDRNNNETFEPVFMPWPGESLKLSLIRPTGVEGQSITIDAARLELSPGVRLVKATLTIAIRSSQGGVQEITLPKNATVQGLTVNDNKRTFRAKAEKLEVNLKPGSQKIEVTWQQAGGIKRLYRAPKVSVGRVSANVTVVVNLPSDRWLLLAGGPSWGPAILFWGFLVTILLAGLILGRVRLSPLKTWQWMLLALGLTQVPVPVALIIVGWFLALSWRAGQPFENVVLHNGFQIVLVIWTITALGCLVGAVYDGLAVLPDMQVQGAGSTNTKLVWYMDKIKSDLPTPWVLSVPILIWKLIMLAWALWLAWSIIKWAPWAWRSYGTIALWRSWPKKKKLEKGKVAAKKASEGDEKTKK